MAQTSVAETVSYFLITFLTSIALKTGIDRLQDMIHANLLSQVSLIISIAFFATLFRFFFRNLAAMSFAKKFKDEHEERHPFVSLHRLSFWTFNMLFILIEMLFFYLMSGFIGEMQYYFVIFVLVVLLIDLVWTWGYSRIFFRKNPKPLDYFNILATMLIQSVIIFIYGLNSEITPLLVSILLLGSASFELLVLWLVIGAIRI